MGLLTRAEEFVLLAIWVLGGDAYSLEIQKEISAKSGEKWSLGTIYAPLERLEKRGLIESSFSESTPARGGRRKRIYKLHPAGRKALLRIREVQECFWANLSDLVVEGEGDRY